MVFYRRGSHVIEFQAGEAAPAPEEACGVYYFNPVPGHYTTLIGKFQYKQAAKKKSVVLYIYFIFCIYFSLLPPCF